MTTQFTRRDMLKRAAGITLGGAALAAGVSLKDVAAQRATGTGLPVDGVITDTGATFSGVLSGLTASLDRATGLISVTGTITAAAGTVLDAVTGATSDTFTSTLAQEDLGAEPGVCDVLYLDLGPLHLDLLGLVIDLNPIVLDIDAVPGGGNLLGNLLCAITGLLDSPGQGVLNGITNLLNRIFSLLG